MNGSTDTFTGKQWEAVKAMQPIRDVQVRLTNTKLSNYGFRGKKRVWQKTNLYMLNKYKQFLPGYGPNNSPNNCHEVANLILTENC